METFDVAVVGVPDERLKYVHALVEDAFALSFGTSSTFGKETFFRATADINALVEESLNLAYHGARAEKSSFNITLKHDFDPDAGAVELYPQEITRALLNLISVMFTTRAIFATRSKNSPIW